MIRNPFSRLTKGQLAQLEERIQTAEAELQKLRNGATLVSLERDGRALVWVFMRNGETIVIRTYSQISDNLPGWKAALGLLKQPAQQ